MPELARLDDIRKKRPLLHCISNTVTANDCANLALALGASPMMAEAPEEAAETARFLLTLSQAEGYHELTDPMREAAQGHVLTLTALLPPETAAELAEWYRGQYRRSQRLPVQKKVLNALERRGKGA